MKILFYIIVVFFAILGVGVLNSAAQTKFRKIGLTIGGLTYVGAAVLAYILQNWYPLLIGFVISIVIKYLFGDESK